jgi:hypothetical protein
VYSHRYKLTDSRSSATGMGSPCSGSGLSGRLHLVAYCQGESRVAAFAGKHAPCPDTGGLASWIKTCKQVRFSALGVSASLVAEILLRVASIGGCTWPKDWKALH